MRRGPREPFYIRGDFYRVDDRTGFKVRATEQQQEWTKLYVQKSIFEYRHPQDFLAGVLDDQTVPDPRPRSGQDLFEGPLQVVLVQNAGPGAGVAPPAIFGDVLIDPANTFILTDPTTGNVLTAPP